MTNENLPISTPPQLRRSDMSRSSNSAHNQSQIGGQFRYSGEQAQQEQIIDYHQSLQTDKGSQEGTLGTILMSKQNTSYNQASMLGTFGTIKQNPSDMSFSYFKKISQMSKFQEVRNKIISRDNWNFFNGDPDYKTDFFLRFKAPHIKEQYLKRQISVSSYSLRVLLIILAILNMKLNSYQNPNNEISTIDLILNLLILSISIYGTTPKIQQYTKKFSHIILIINLVPFIFGFTTSNIIQNYELQYELLNESVQMDSHNVGQQESIANETISGATDSNSSTISLRQELQLLHYLLHNLSFLFINLCVISDWLEFFILTNFFNLVYAVWIRARSSDPVSFSLIHYIASNNVALVLFSIIFSVYEKSMKEQFIVGITNSKTKKNLMKIFNQILPSVIVNKEGAILMCNEQFENLVTRKFNIVQVPQNLVRMIQHDIQSKNKIINVIDKILQKQKENNIYGDEPQEFKLILKKDKLSQRSNNLSKGQCNLLKNPAQSQIDHALTLSPLQNNMNKVQLEVQLENYYQKYEAFKVTASLVPYKQSRQVLFIFESITDQMAQFRLLDIHTNLISKFLVKNQNRMESLHRQLIQQNQTELQTQVGEFLGNSQVTLNMVQQLSYYLKFISNMNDSKPDNYVLSEEIDYCLDVLTASKWDKEIEVYLTRGQLPNQVVGDLEKFRICFRTMLEFGIKYSNDDTMQVKCEFKERGEGGSFVIQFSIIVNKNSQYNLDPLKDLFQQMQENDFFNEDLSFDKQIHENYSQFFEHIKDFGYGMIVFPTIVKQLNGTFFLHSEYAMDEDQSNTNPLQSGKIRIGCKLPFEHAGGDRIISQSHYRINPNRQDFDQKTVFKTPQIKNNRQVDSQEVERFRKLINDQGVPSISSNSKNGGGNRKGQHAAPSPNLQDNSLPKGQFLPQDVNSNDYASVNNHSIQRNLRGNSNSIVNSIGSLGSRNIDVGGLQALNPRKNPNDPYQSQNKDQINKTGMNERRGYNTQDNRNNTVTALIGSNQQPEIVISKPNEQENSGSCGENYDGSSHSFNTLSIPAPNDHLHKGLPPAISAVHNLKSSQGLNNNLITPFNDRQHNTEMTDKESGDKDKIQSVRTSKQKIPSNMVTSLKNQLLGKIQEDGQGKQFFQVPNKEANGYQSTQTADFKSRKSPLDGQINNNAVKNNPSDELQQSGHQSSIQSNNNDMKNNAPAFSFMEGSIRNSQTHNSNKNLENYNINIKSNQNIDLNQICKKQNNVDSFGGEINSSSLNGNSSSAKKYTDDSGSEKKTLQYYIGTQIKQQRKSKNGEDLAGLQKIRTGNSYPRGSQNAIKQPNEEGSSIMIPQSIQMDSNLNFQNQSSGGFNKKGICPSIENIDDNDSEQKDRVNSLIIHQDPLSAINSNGPNISKNSISLGSSDDAPYNFQMDKIDSFIGESEDGGAVIGHSLGSQKLKKYQYEERKDPNEIVKQIKEDNFKRINCHSKNIKKLICYNFSEIEAASKHLLTQPMQKVYKIQKKPTSNFEEQKQEEDPSKAESQKQSNISSKQDHLSVQPSAISRRSPELKNFVSVGEIKPQSMIQPKNIFLKNNYVANQNPFAVDNMKSNMANINIKVTNKSNTKYIQAQRDIQSDLKQQKQLKLLNKQRNQNKMSSLSQKPAVIEIWQPNLVFHPKEKNAEYDAMDKDQTLKFFPALLDDMVNCQLNETNNEEMRSTHKNSGQVDLSSNSSNQVINALKSPQYSKNEQIMLIVEDSDFIQANIQAQLKMLNVNFEAAMNGQEGVEKVEKYLKQNKLFNIILMDLIMPVMNGYDASKKIRELEHKYGVSEGSAQFICGYSSQISLDVEKKCFENGFDDVCAKPIEFKILQKMLSQHNQYLHSNIHSSTSLSIKCQGKGSPQQRKYFNGLTDKSRTPEVRPVEGQIDTSKVIHKGGQRYSTNNKHE